MISEEEQKRIKEEMDLFSAIKTKMNVHEHWTLEDARIVFNKIHCIEGGKKQTSENKKQKKKGLNLGTKYSFTERPGQATNKQLEFIQFLRKKAEEGELKISLTVENVPKMKYEDADREIKRLKEKLGWKDKEE